MFYVSLSHLSTNLSFYLSPTLCSISPSLISVFNLVVCLSLSLSLSLTLCLSYLPVSICFSVSHLSLCPYALFPLCLPVPLPLSMSPSSPLSLCFSLSSSLSLKLSISLSVCMVVPLFVCLAAYLLSPSLSASFILSRPPLSTSVCSSSLSLYSFLLLFYLFLSPSLLFLPLFIFAISPLMSIFLVFNYASVCVQEGMWRQSMP